jgi:hypothetical protein
MMFRIGSFESCDLGLFFDSMTCDGIVRLLNYLQGNDLSNAMLTSSKFKAV